MGLAATQTTIDSGIWGLGSNQVGSTTGTNWWQDLIGLGAQTGANIATARYGTVPVYTTTNTPYGSSQTIYQPGISPQPGTNVFGTPVGGGFGSTSVLLIAGLGVVLLLANK